MKKLAMIAAVCMLLSGCGTAGTEQAAETESAVKTTSAAEGTTVTTTSAAETTASEITTTLSETTAAETTLTTIQKATEEDAGGEYDIDKGIFVTTITYPFAMLEKFSEFGKKAFDAEEWRSDFETNENIVGVISSEIDGENLVVKFKTREYNKMKAQTIDGIMNSGNEIECDESNSITRIEYDDDFANITAYVTSEAEYKKNYDVMELVQFVSNIYYTNEFYSFFSDSYTLRVIDEQTGAEFYTYNYPE